MSPPSRAERDNARFIILISLGFLESSFYIVNFDPTITGSITLLMALGAVLVIFAIFIVLSHMKTAFPSLAKHF